MATTDFTKLPLDILTDLINDTNSIALVTADLTYGAISALSSGADNTGVTVTAVAGSGYTGAVDLTYNRVDFAAVPGTRSKKFQKGSAVNISDLIPAINAAYQLNLQTTDFVDGPLPTFEGDIPHDNKPFTLTAAAGSYIYINAVVLELDANDIALNSVITTTALAGLNYPAL